MTLTLAEADRLWARKHQELLQEFEGMMRTLMSDLEEDYNVKIPTSHRTVAWFAEHAGEVSNRVHAG